MTAGYGGKGRKTTVFRPLFLFLGSWPGTDQRHKNKARQSRFDRRAGICYNASVGLSVPPLRTEQ